MNTEGASRRHRVAILAGSLIESPGGITRYVGGLLESALIRDRGFQLVHLVTHAVKSPPIKLYLALRATLAMARFSFNGDIAHAQIAADSSYVRKFLILREAQLLGLRTVAHLHGSTTVEWLERLPESARNVVLGMARGCDVVITLGERLAGYLRSHGVSRIQVIPNGVNRVPMRADPDPAQVRIMSSGRLGERKGTADLIRAFAVVRGRFPAAELVLAGDGDVTGATRLAGELGLGRSVRVTGWLSHAASLELLSASTVFTLPSYQEGMSLSVLEAMMRGVPVVATPVGEHNSVIDDGRNGLLVTPGDVPALARALERIISDPVRARDLGAAAHRTATERFDIQRNHEAVAGVYESLVGRAIARAAQRQ